MYKQTQNSNVKTQNYGSSPLRSNNNLSFERGTSREVPKKVLVLGSGALKIGQAGEFDYSGSQALKALKEERIKTILINPNIATIQTSKDLADKIYFLPIDTHFVEEVIKKEKVDGIMLSFGGQTALNCGLELKEKRILKNYGVRVLGSPIQSIKVTEDRELFAKELRKIGVKVAKGGFAKTTKKALEIGKKIGFPVIVRSAYALGGLGSAVVEKRKDLEKIASIALQNSPQISVEEYLKHWKEVEYEVVRDSDGNKITVCNMENLDPLGIHTGESIVVAPSQTLNNYQYHFLRNVSLRVIEHLKIAGECNIQFALDPASNDYRVIEVNARLSRSSALASKATGYPLAYVAAKLGLGYKLPELKNSVTLSTSAFFEPSLDYIVIKIPRWDFQKFTGVKAIIGSSMQSVGEVMAIGRSFPEVLQKALRMLEIGRDGFLSKSTGNGKKALENELIPHTQRLFALAKELAEGMSIEKAYKLTGIDPWFLYQIKEIVDFEVPLKKGEFKLDEKHLKKAKLLGFSDRQIGRYLGKDEGEIRKTRKDLNILPKVKHIDTLAAEYPARTNYLYLTYHASESEVDSDADPAEIQNFEATISTSYVIPAKAGIHSDRSPIRLASLPLRRSGSGMTGKNKVIVIGSGPYRIGSSVEFDWCSVVAAQTFRKKGLETIIINCNPETVSTDYDVADKLYFEELTLERVSDIYEIEKSASLALAFGGQISNNLAIRCFNSGFKILGTKALNIDKAENRHKFSKLLDELKINQPLWQELKSEDEALKFAQKISFPVLVRPSYVLSGSAMNIANRPMELSKYLKDAADVSPEHPVVISKFESNAKEIEIDGVGKKGELIIYAISEHIENAGVHSGDATVVLPPQKLYLETMRQIKSATKKIVKALDITGPFNIQFLAKDNEIKVIELNLRASRSFPFVSKVTGYNFIEMASKIMLGQNLEGDFKTINIDYVGVKAPQFSFNRIKGADPKLRVEMSSTGEVACFGEDLEEAYLKALLSTGFKFPKKGIFLSLQGDENRIDFLNSAKRIYALHPKDGRAGFKIYATESTHYFLTQHRIKSKLVHKISENKKPSTIDLIIQGEVDLAINISKEGDLKGEKDRYIIRRACVDYGVSFFTNLQAAIALSRALSTKTLKDLEVKSWDEYVKILTE